jgi:hypothetical protein
VSHDFHPLTGAYRPLKRAKNPNSEPGKSRKNAKTGLEFEFFTGFFSRLSRFFAV